MFKCHVCGSNQSHSEYVVSVMNYSRKIYGRV